jgi:signal transduction histidine kinase/CheY-like chemotaxis protein
MFSQLSWKRRLQPTLVPALVFVVVALMLTIVTRQLLTLQEESRHTQDVKDTLASITAVMQESENGMRGFLLTGDDDFLKPYNTASHEIGPALDRLQSLVDDNPVQRENVARLRPVVLERMSQLTRAVGYYQPGRTLPVPIGSGPETHARARDIIAAMMAEEDRILGERRRSVGRIATYLQLLAYGTLFIVMTVAVFALYRSQRQRGELETAQQALRASNAKLSAEIGEREKVEDQLRQVQKMEAIGQLTGGIAHDFNNMLAVIIGALNIMQRRIDKGDMNVKEFMKAAMDGAMRGGALTQRLLAFARKQVLEPRALDVNKLVSGMSDLLRRTLGEMVQTEVVLAGGLWRVFVDAHQLETVVLNLVVNARDAMPEGGKLTIETANAHLDEGYVGRHTDVPPGQYVLLCVSDTGTGMPPEVLQKAFDPFFTTKSAGRGTGLGLSQVYGFVRQSGGHVKIYSEPGHGATVKIYLPRYHGPADEGISAKISGALPQAKSGELVLVVEDEEAVRALTSEGLRDLGYEVLAAGGGAEALTILDQNPKIDLLFTDIVMPEINGRQLADEAKKRRPNLKVLFTTGYTRNAVVHNGTLDPGVRLLGKPFTLEQLSRIVRDVLDGK